MNLRRSLLLAAFVTLSSAASHSAFAQCGAYNGGYYGGYGYGYWDIGRLYGLLADEVPYYAAFPPVYYSVPVARTYGYSPFAYPPGVMTPEVEVGGPLEIQNPYYEGDVKEAEPVPAPSEEAPAPANPTTKVQAQRGPLMVVNPFVKGSLAPSRLAATR
jgi:hypothetical protein